MTSSYNTSSLVGAQSSSYIPHTLKIPVTVATPAAAAGSTYYSPSAAAGAIPLGLSVAVVESVRLTVSQ